MPIAEIGGVPIAYSDTGNPPGHEDPQAIVFGHGLLFGGWMFGPQIEALRGRYRCITIDWRGQGETPPTAGGYDMDTLAADAAGLIHHLGVAPVHWVGLSMGGFVGQRLAARQPDLLRSLTLLDTSARQEDPAKIGEYKRLALAVRLFGFRAIQTLVEPHMFGPAFRSDPASGPVIREWSGRLRRLRRTAVHAAVLGVADRASVLDEIPAITVPTLVAVGADDQATPPDRAREITALIPEARLEIIDTCGHTSTIEQPDVVATLLARFLHQATSSNENPPTAPEEHRADVGSSTNTGSPVPRSSVSPQGREEITGAGENQTLDSATRTRLTARHNRGRPAQ
ncbi:alpha/beta fold hydrolase [Nocardia aurantiaca]|uniref:Alpha/beta fold hydrolase n=1 Tax=Nocardia aurantiaca TaxID=2675850 RepID=A0A6I3L5X7_9NOCA|nr:alpha/beta fold hydrolase [Nocardia aurantiaca]MTE15866.1 alpha/beta fold hydrolase [Nocardia aurantiaca]